MHYKCCPDLGFARLNSVLSRTATDSQRVNAIEETDFSVSFTFRTAKREVCDIMEELAWVGQKKKLNPEAGVWGPQNRLSSGKKKKKGNFGGIRKPGCSWESPTQELVIKQIRVFREGIEVI